MKRVITWLRLTVALLLSLTIQPAVINSSATAAALTQMSYEPGVYLSPYRTKKAPPPELGEFASFTLKELPEQEGKELVIDSAGNVPISGRLYTTDGLVYNFTTAKLIKGKKGYEQLTFTTEKLGGVRYTFKGEYLEDSEEEQGQYITLKGVLTKYRDGQKVASSSLGFYQWVIS